MARSLFGSIRDSLSGKDSKKSSTPTNHSSTSTTQPRGTNPVLQNSTAPMQPPSSFQSPQNAAIAGPPPAYTPEPAQAPVQTSSNAGSDNDPYAFLTSFDTVFVIDDSGSMVGRSWAETQRALEAITPICTAHDADGIDIFFLNAPDSEFYQNITSVATVREIFTSVRPRGQTPLGTKLNRILRPYLEKYARDPEGTKPMNVIVITDGEPSDDPESTIIYAARKLNTLDAPPWQVGIQFFQVGREQGAREYLLSLDNDLEDKKTGGRDMVDTQPWTNEDGYELNGEGILKAVLGSVNKRLDNKRLDQLFVRR